MITVEGLSKRFLRHHHDRPFTLQEVFQRGLGSTEPRDFFWGLDDVSFSVDAGHAVGIIGSNGAGKSTLLRLIGGVGRPDKGAVMLGGRVGGLLGLGSDFHPDLSGRENIFVSGVIAGLTYREVRERFDSIVDFSEIGEFIDNPIRTYSSGMQLRLAFAVASHVDADILLIDEVFAVGDAPFQKKCFDRILRFKDEGCTTLVVSHDSSLIEEFCDEALWLEHGRLVGRGPPTELLKRYTGSHEGA